MKARTLLQALFATALLPTAACNVSLCPTVLAPGITIQARDSVTNALVFGFLTATVTDASYSDTRAITIAQRDTATALLQLAAGRAGNFHVVVRDSLHATYTRDNVRVNSAICGGAQTVAIVAKLQPKPH